MATAGNLTLAQTNAGVLHSLPRQGDSLQSLWSVDIGSVRLLSAAVVQGDQVVLAGGAGEILVLNVSTGAEIRRHKLPQRLARLVATPAGPVAIATDGSLYPLPSAAGGQP